MSLDRIVYFGTPDFAVPSLRAMADDGRAPALVVTQPPRRSGRGMRLQPSPVALAAVELGLPLAEVASVRDAQFLDQLRDLELDLAVVAAFGQIFRRSLLQLPRLGCLNIHASLLPAYRGGAPIQAVIANGEAETGVSMMWMERGLDSGRVLVRRRLPIEAGEIASDLSNRLAELGASTLMEMLALIEGGDAIGEVPAGELQDPLKVSYAPQLKRQDGLVDWNLSAQTLYDRWRGYQPWPGIFVNHRGEAVKLMAVTNCEVGVSDVSDLCATPGVVAEVNGANLVIACGEGMLAIELARRPGRGAVSGRELADGLRLSGGDPFGVPGSQSQVGS